MQSPATRAAELRHQLDHHNQLYYTLSTPEIGDAEYDRMFRELEDLERAHPELVDENSPTRRVGEAPIEGFVQITHPVPMLSIDDVFELPAGEIEGGSAGPPPQAELIAFYQRLRKSLGREEIAVTVEPKIDGVAVTLLYEGGSLKYAATRGDGSRGDDVTHNVRTIRRLPLRLANSAGIPVPEVLEVRGEIFMPIPDFNEMNRERDEAGQPVFANPRNATSGTVKQFDPRIAAARPLGFLAHGLGAYEGVPLETEHDFHALLDALGIARNQPVLTATTLEELLEAVANLAAHRHDSAIATDGAVIKILSHRERRELGATSRAPRWAAAYKFLPEQIETTLRNIAIQVGRTGVLTPVAELDPVLISGSTVARATLHNQDEITRKDIRIGARVLIEKAGEIIPAVVRVIEHAENSAPYSLMDAVHGRCPSCREPVSQEPGFVALRCTNYACPAQAASRISHFASRKALDIDGMGNSAAEAVVAAGLCQRPLDLFKLDERVLANLNLGDTSQIRRLGEKRAARIVASIEAARSRPLSRWLFGLGIRHLGEGAAKELARHHRRFSDLQASPILHELAAATTADAKSRSSVLSNANVSADVGPVVASSLLEFFESDAGKSVVADLNTLELDPVSDTYLPPGSAADTSQLPLIGKTFVITGTLSLPRETFAQRIEALGGNVSSAVSKKTSYLLAGQEAGSKLEKAMALGTEILNEAEFEKLCEI